MRRFLRMLFDVGEFLLYFLWELILANLRVARDVIRPIGQLRPAVVAVPLDLESDWRITLLAILVTLTPGTLSLDVSSDRKVLYIHVMHMNGASELRSQIKAGFELRVMRLLT